MEKELEIKLQKDGRLRRVEKNKIWYERVIKTNLMLEGWRDWWRMVELESVKDGKKRRLTRQEEKKNFHIERIAPNLLLTGWRTWWSRMEAEKKKGIITKKLENTKDSKIMEGERVRKVFIEKFFTRNSMNSHQTPVKTTTSDLEEDRSIQKDGKLCSDRKSQNFSLENSKCGQITPKRKKNFSNLHTGEISASKRQKLSPKFTQNLEFWRQHEDNTQRGPTVSTLRIPNKGGGDQNS